MANKFKFSSEKENIENYKMAKRDNFKRWQCHHRLETHNSDGERRLIQLNRAELMALDMYYNRPADELIFLRLEEHTRIHSMGRKCSDEHKLKVSMSLKGHILSKETRLKISNTLKGGHIPVDVLRKRSITQKKVMSIKKTIYEFYKNKMTWNEFQTYYRLNRKMLHKKYNINGGNII